MPPVFNHISETWVKSGGNDNFLHSWGEFVFRLSQSIQFLTLVGWVCHNLYEPVACKHEHLFSNQIAMLVWESQPLQNLLPTPTPSFYTIIKQSSGQAACWLFRYYGQLGSIFCPSFTMCKKTFLRPKQFLYPWMFCLAFFPKKKETCYHFLEVLHALCGSNSIWKHRLIKTIFLNCRWPPARVLGCSGNSYSVGKAAFISWWVVEEEEGGVNCDF